jgi:phage shock protein C
MTDKVLSFFQRQAFGVCSWWGQKLGIDPARIRLSFIYISFATLGSPILIYLFMWFLKKNRAYFRLRPKRSTFWDLED